MIYRKALHALALVPLLGLAGCGDSSASGPKFTAASGDISLATATANRDAIVNGAKLNFTSPVGKPGARREDDDPFAACTTKTPAGATDTDSDGFKTETRVYACNSVPYGGGGLTASQNGTTTETDKDEGDAKSGFKIAYDITGSHSGGDNWTYSGFWELTKSATSIIYASDYAGTNSNTRRGRVASSGTGGGTWSHTITPTDMANPYTAGGAIETSGYFAYNFIVDGVTTNYVFKMTSSGLTYGAHPCSNFYNGGSYTFTDAASHTFTVTFTSCGAYTVKYGDTTI